VRLIVELPVFDCRGDTHTGLYCHARWPQFRLAEVTLYDVVVLSVLSYIDLEEDDH